MTHSRWPVARSGEHAHEPRQKPDHYMASCEGKQAFDYSVAVQVARDMNRARKRGSTKRARAPAHVFRCKFCRRWHIGSNK